MNNKTIDNVKLGAFVLAGSLFLILCLYLIGKNRNLFGSNFTIHADFHNVNGLTIGNNVRFSGIDVGTVRRIEIISDTSVRVSMVIDKDIRPYIKKNSIASVGTDGLMGDKLININTPADSWEPIENDGMISTLKPIETDEMLRTLNTTNDNIEVISTDLKKITQKIANSQGLWSLLSDTILLKDLQDAAKNIRMAGHQATMAGQELTSLIVKTKKGDGLIGTILNDTTLTNQLKKSLINIHESSEKTREMTLQLNQLISRIKNGEGTAGTLLSDTALENQLRRSILQVEQGTERFNENMKAMRQNFLFRSYFKKLEKEESKKNSNE